MNMAEQQLSELSFDQLIASECEAIRQHDGLLTELMTSALRRLVQLQEPADGAPENEVHAYQPLAALRYAFELQAAAYEEPDADKQTAALARADDCLLAACEAYQQRHP